MLKLPSSFSMIHIVEFLSISLLFLTLISSARSTRIKIGPKAWAYQIDLNQGNQMRQEFSDKNGVTNGFYQFRTGNQTKKLMYTIDPNRKEPDIVFNVVNVDHSNGLMMNDCNQFPNQSNMTFDSIDSSDEDFKGHVTLKVANSSYNINFASGDRSNSREEVLSPNGLLYGRYNFMTKNNPQKIVINYKFNSTATDPTFEVSLFKSSILNDLEREQDRDSFDAIYHNHPNANLRNAYHRTSPYAPGGSSSLSSPSSISSNSLRSQDQSRASMNEKYRSQHPQLFNYRFVQQDRDTRPPSSSSSSPLFQQRNTVPSWYFNRNKSDEQ